MRHLMIAAAASAALALTACATAAPYQPLQRGSAVSGGFSEQQVESNRWRIAMPSGSSRPRRPLGLRASRWRR